MPPLSEILHILCSSGYLPCANFLFHTGIVTSGSDTEAASNRSAKSPPLCALTNAPKWEGVWQEGHSGPTSLVR
jgi:hypothetical protein